MEAICRAALITRLDEIKKLEVEDEAKGGTK